MSDWGADHDRVASLNAGLNLEMPPSYTDDQIVYAARDGRIQPEQLDRMAQGMIDLVNKTRAAMSVDDYRFDVDAHDEVAHQAAIESMVLLKNDDDILPVAANAKIAVIGEFARTPRYQGGGSSHITPTKMTSFLDTLAARGVDVAFAPASPSTSNRPIARSKAEAVETAKKRRRRLMFLGLPEPPNPKASTVKPSTFQPSRSNCSKPSPPKTRTSSWCCPTDPSSPWHHGRATPRASSNPGCLARRAVRRSPT